MQIAFVTLGIFLCIWLILFLIKEANMHQKEAYPDEIPYSKTIVLIAALCCIQATGIFNLLSFLPYEYQSTISSVFIVFLFGSHVALIHNSRETLRKYIELKKKTKNRLGL